VTNWKTTAAGVLAALGILLAGASAMLDSDPNTTVNSKSMLEALGTLITAAGIGSIGWFSKDKD
jgi:hypothetical protein